MLRYIYKNLLNYKYESQKNRLQIKHIDITIYDFIVYITIRQFKNILNIKLHYDKYYDYLNCICIENYLDLCMNKNKIYMYFHRISGYFIVDNTNIEKCIYMLSVK